MPRRPVLTEEQVRAEFVRIKEGGLKLLSAYPTKAEYYYWRRLFTDLGLCGHQSRPDRLVRARKYCVNWRLKNKDKLKCIREQKSEALRQVREQTKAQKRQQLEECRKALLATRALTKKSSVESLTASSALENTPTKRSRKSVGRKKDATTCDGPETTCPSSTSPPAAPLQSS